MELDVDCGMICRAFSVFCLQLFLSTLIAREPISQLKTVLSFWRRYCGRFQEKPFYSGSSEGYIEISGEGRFLPMNYDE